MQGLGRGMQLGFLVVGRYQRGLVNIFSNSRNMSRANSTAQKQSESSHTNRVFHKARFVCPESDYFLGECAAAIHRRCTVHEESRSAVSAY